MQAIQRVVSGTRKPTINREVKRFAWQGTIIDRAAGKLICRPQNDFLSPIANALEPLSTSQTP